MAKGTKINNGVAEALFLLAVIVTIGFLLACAGTLPPTSGINASACMSKASRDNGGTGNLCNYPDCKRAFAQDLSHCAREVTSGRSGYDMERQPFRVNLDGYTCNVHVYGAEIDKIDWNECMTRLGWPWSDFK
jgi:hypothetical protein